MADVMFYKMLVLEDGALEQNIIGPVERIWCGRSRLQSMLLFTNGGAGCGMKSATVD